MWRKTWDEGQRLYRAEWLDAAEEQFHRSLQCSPDAVSSAKIMDAMGRIAIQRNRNQVGIRWLRKALQALVDHQASESDVAFGITMHLNMALSLGTDEDRALRGLQRLESQVSAQPQRQQAIYHLNLGVVYIQAQLYPQALVRLRQAQQVLTQNDLPAMGYPLHTNLGVVLLALGDFVSARQELLTALTWSPNAGLHALNELTRLAILSNDEQQAKEYGRQAIKQMWESLMTFEKSELANLCEILAQFAGTAGDASLRRQLIDTAQTLYGQMGVWRHWRRLQEHLVPPDDRHDRNATPFLDDIRRFLQLLQMMLAQNILHEKLPAVADVRTQVAQALAAAHNWNTSQRHAITMVSRLADVGLTAIDYDVVHEPHRNATTWHRYTQHPALSLQLLATLGLPTKVMAAIGDHHEQPDGQGFPAGKDEASISPLSQVFSVAHAYAWDVIYQEIPHSQTLRNLEAKTPHQLPKTWVNTLLTLF